MALYKMHGKTIQSSINNILFEIERGAKGSIWEEVNLKKRNNVSCDKDDFLLPFIHFLLFL